MADETATVDDDFQESKTQQRSYVEVNGPVPKGPVIDENGLAQQVSGPAPTPLADETATVGDDLQEPQTPKRSYVEVNGPVPTGPVIDENGLAQQVSGAAPTPITSDSLIPPDSEVSPTSEDTPAAKEEAAESAEAPTSEGSPESEESPTSEESPAKAASPLRGGDSSKSVAFAPPKHPPHMCNVAKTLLTRQRQFRQGSPVPLRSPHSSARRRSAREVSHGLWIIWLGVGLSACMASLGYHWLLSQSALWICGIVWGIFNIPLSEFFRSLFFTAAAIFFKVRTSSLRAVAVRTVVSNA
mgnify:FL=1